MTGSATSCTKELTLSERLSSEGLMAPPAQIHQHCILLVHLKGLTGHSHAKSEWPLDVLHSLVLSCLLFSFFCASCEHHFGLLAFWHVFGVIQQWDHQKISYRKDVPVHSFELPLPIQRLYCVTRIVIYDHIRDII